MIKIIAIATVMIFVTEKSMSQTHDLQKIDGNSVIFNSQILNADREIQIYLPVNYNSSATKYPVLYVLDGQRYFLNGITFQRNLTWQELAPEFIIVGIVTDSQKRRTLFYEESAKFIQFLEKELIPGIDKEYRTLDQRIFFGWEMAAGLGVEILADQPHLFNGYLLASPTHISNNRLAKVADLLKRHLKKRISIYACLGLVENWAHESMSSLDSIFQQYSGENVKWQYNLSENENHYTTPLITINEGLKSFFSDYGPIRFYTMKEFEDFGGVRALKEHYANRGNKYQIGIDTHEDTRHYLLLQAQRENNFEIFDTIVKEFDGKSFIEKYYHQAHWFDRFATFYLSNSKLADALELFESGLTKFPDASILHNGMGNYYKASGQVNKAINCYQKAIDLAETNNESELSGYKKNLEIITRSADN